MNRRARATSSAVNTRGNTFRLVSLFAAFYFIQGVTEPTEGLVSQPVRSLLKLNGHTAGTIATYGAILSAPWMLKPIYGLITDFVPIRGLRRRGYLLIMSLLSLVGFGWVAWEPTTRDQATVLLAWLFLPTVGVAFTDVVVDALMVEKGQPLGLTGTLQSAQWSAMYLGTIAAGLIGGWASEHAHYRWAFGVCAALMGLMTLLTWQCVHETPEPATATPLRLDQLGQTMREQWRAARTPQVCQAAAFLFLWNFNPFSSSVLYLHLTKHVGLSEQAFGVTTAWLSVGAILGSLAYGLYCRRVTMIKLIHVSIVAGVLSTLLYALVVGPRSANATSVMVGAAYMTGSMVQFDLAARACPVSAAGTTFALLMSLSNLSVSLSTALGGRWYERWAGELSAGAAFQRLIVLGALTTSACWLLLPWLREPRVQGDPH